MSQGFTAQSAAGSASGAFPSSATQEVVAVLNEFSQVFRGARPMKASVKEEAKLMEHPLEDGSVITDHMVIQPVEIEISMTLTPETLKETFREIKDLFHKGTVLTVMTKADSYANMLIQAIPHDEVPEMFDTFTLSLKLKNVTTIRPEFAAGYKAKKNAQSKTEDKGEAQPQEKGSWASKKIKW